MNPLSAFIPPWWRWLAGAAAALLVMAAIGWYGEWRADARGAEVKQAYEMQIGRQKVQAATELAGETRKALALERALADVTAKLEDLDAKNQRDAADAQRRLTALAGVNAGRLRDPNAAGCRGSGGRAPGQTATAAVGGDGGAAQAGGLLSEQLSGLLRRLEAESDEVNNAYAACRPWAIEVRDRMNTEAGGP